MVDQHTHLPGPGRAAGTRSEPETAGAHDEQPVKVVDRRWWVREPDRDGTGGNDPDWQPRKPSYVEQLEQQVAEKDDRLRALAAQYREATAEFDNVRARMRRDVAKDIERGRRTMLVELLEVLDNLDRAVQAGSAATSPERLLEGVGLIRDQFLAKLQGFGVQRMDVVGEAFDPTRHEAVTVVPAASPADEGRIVGVIADGYLTGDEVLRPAMVAVARSGEA